MTFPTATPVSAVLAVGVFLAATLAGCADTSHASADTRETSYPDARVPGAVWGPAAMPQSPDAYMSTGVMPSASVGPDSPPANGR